MMMLKSILAATTILAGTVVAYAEYPEQPITLIVPWNAGGGTDAIARSFAAGLEQELGVNVSVVNRAGGAGVIGHDAMTKAQPDGYTIGLATAELTSYWWNNTGQFTYEDLTPIALVNFDPAAFHVAADSEWQDLQQALDAINKAPANTYKLSGMGSGAAYHLAFAGLLQAKDIDPLKVTVVPSQGAAPGFQELAAGGVQIIPSSLPEGRTMVEAGRAKALAVLGDERNPAFPDVPTVKEAIGLDYAGGTWRGIVAPAGIPDDAKAKLADASAKVIASDEFKEFMKAQGYGIRFEDADGFGAFLAEQHKRVGEVMKALNLRQRD